jgi:hypothetical protein
VSALLAALFGRAGRWALVVLGALGAVLAIRRSGERAGRAEATTELMEDTQHAMEIRKAAERDLSAAADAELDGWLRAPGKRGAAGER